MDNIAEYIRTTFDGILVIGDVHSEFEALERARLYAQKENFFLMSLGDLVDRGTKPFETVKCMHDIVYEGRGGFVTGNHDNKFYRYAKGNKVRFSLESQLTLRYVADREKEFLDMYVTLTEARMLSSIFHKVDEYVFIHAATHKDIWDKSDNIGKSAKDMAIVGEVTGEKQADGYPVRLYNWVNDIPMGKTVIVGHDMRPMNVASRLTEPFISTNSNGGKVIFMDTGCGKGGYLTGAILMKGKKDQFFFEGVVSFS